MRPRHDPPHSSVSTSPGFSGVPRLIRDHTRNERWYPRIVATWRASYVKLGFHMSEPYAKIQKGEPGCHGCSAERSDARSSVGESGFAADGGGAYISSL